MGQGRGAWVVGLCLALVGCGSASSQAPRESEPAGSLPEDPGAPASAPEEATAPTESTVVSEDSPLEGSAAMEAARTPSPLEAEPSLPPRACIPWKSPAPPVRATACASDSIFANGTSQHARYDADSHPLEVRTYAASGALTQKETQVWRGGLQRSQRVERPDGTFDQTEWTYNTQSQLERRVITNHMTSGTYTRSVDLTYDAQGRIAQAIGDNNGWIFTSHYTYDATGRLVSIDNDGECGRDENRCETRTYWSNGRLKQQDGELRRALFWNQYNELGQLVSSKLQDDQAFTTTTRAYDPVGQLVRLRESFQGSGNTVDTYIETLTTTVRDPAGLRERFARDTHTSEVCYTEPCEPDGYNDVWSYKRVTRRTTFFCGTQIVARDEWDSNENGVVDARRTHERDAKGRLVHEAYSGTPGLDEGPVTREFHYDCH